MTKVVVFILLKQMRQSSDAKLISTRMEAVMTLWHLEPVLEEIQKISKDSEYFSSLNKIAEEHVGLSLGDLETIGVPRLSLFLLGNQEVDVSKALIAYEIFEKLLAFEDNMFCAAMYRRKVKDLYAVLIEIADRHNLSLENYLAS
jgi:hypothetical protein